MNEAVVRCPKCNVKLRITLTSIPEQTPTKKPVESEKEFQVEVVSEPKVKSEAEAIDWKPWKRGTGEWANMLDAMGLFMEIQKAGGQLERGGYRYWIFGRNRDMIARKSTRHA